MQIRNVSLLAFTASIGLLLSTSANANEWYEDADFKLANVSSDACDTMLNPSYRFLIAKDPFSLGGHPATGKVYATLNAGGSATDGLVHVIEGRAFAPQQGRTLENFYKNEAAAHVPYVAQLGSSAFPPLFGVGLTLLDWLMSSGGQNATASEVATLIRSGGTLTRSYIIKNDADSHPWIWVQIAFGTSVNNQPRQYVVCSGAYPLKR